MANKRVQATASVPDGRAIYETRTHHGRPLCASAAVPELGRSVTLKDENNAAGAGRGRRVRLVSNFRNHRMIVIVDGAEAWVGGLNVGDEYLGRDPKVGYWRDTHTHLRGPVVPCVQVSFLEDWHWAAGDIPKLMWDP